MTDSIINGKSASLPRISVGETGIEITRFGLGGFHQLEISSEIVHQVIHTYLEEGGNYIETARGYGDGASEEKIGKALEGRRDEVVLCSKTGAATADEARRDLDLTLTALKTDHIEFYLFHGVPLEKLDAITAKNGALEGFLKAREEGLIKGIGLSSHYPPVYLEAMRRLPLSLILVWCNYLDNHNFPIIPDHIIPEAKSLGVTVTGMKPLADGFLYRSPENAVRYALGAGADCAVCGANSPQQVREIAHAVRLGPAGVLERKRILEHAPELGNYVCRRCSGCPKELKEIFRLEGWFDRQMIDFLPHDPADHALRGVLSHWFGTDGKAREEYRQSNCDLARLEETAKTVHCPYGIDIPRKIGFALAKLADEKPERL